MHVIIPLLQYGSQRSARICALTVAVRTRKGSSITAVIGKRPGVQPVTPHARSAMPDLAQSYCWVGLQSEAPGNTVISTLPFVRFLTSSTHGTMTLAWWLWAVGAKCEFELDLLGCGVGVPPVPAW
jgi:hypothetical protein